MSDVQVSYYSLQNLERAVSAILQETEVLDAKLQSTNQNVNQVRKELEQLRKDFMTMLQEQRKNELLNRARTELIRVRQEIEQRFGNYQVIRDTMMGVLQATDLALVKKTTISRVSEELMLSTPEYWLAPCLIAVSAWIGNDPQLAERAIAEAVKRDEEKTAITMALICRRNNRTDTCFEWLSLYFSQQSAADFAEDTLTYLTAYTNGVFGQDKNHVCDDYAAKWLWEIQAGNQNVEAEQTAIWEEHFQQYSPNVDDQFPQLNDCVEESHRIKEYVSRIYGLDDISKHFEAIQTAEVDQEKMKADIDKCLVQLISNYFEDEVPLRQEEKYLIYLKAYEDEAKARNMLAAERKEKQDKAVDMVSRMTGIAMNRDSQGLSVQKVAEQKAAIYFLGPYINKGAERYIRSSKEDFPQQCTIRLDNWRGATVDGNNMMALQQEYVNFARGAKQQQLAQMQREKESITPTASYAMMGGGGGMTLLGIIGMAVGSGGLALLMLLGLGLLGFGAYTYFNNQKRLEALDRKMFECNQFYERKINEGAKRIEDIVVEWMQAKHLVYNFEQKPKKQIIV